MKNTVVTIKINNRGTCDPAAINTRSPHYNLCVCTCAINIFIDTNRKKKQQSILCTANYHKKYIYILGFVSLNSKSNW